MPLRFVNRIVPALALFALLGAPHVAHAQDAAQGKRAFGQCRACHTLEEGGRSAAGPNLFGIIGAQSGARDVGFKYSKALTEAALEWTDENLDKWLENPRGFVRGSRMTLKVGDEQRRKDLIAYLKEATQ